MNRKRLFCIFTFSLVVTTLRYQGLGNPFGLILGSAIQAFSVPGWIVAYLFPFMLHTRYAGAIAALIVSTAFWFFPVARLRRWIGTHDPFGNADAARPRLLRFAAHLLDANDRRKFGTTKTGGWS